MSEKRWILVSDGTPQMMYAGQTTLDELSLDKDIEAGKLIELTDCRAMRTILMPTPQDGGISQSEMLSPLSVARCGIRVKIKVQAYFWPDEDSATNSAFMRKILPVEAAEVKHRAHEAGLVTPDGMRL